MFSIVVRRDLGRIILTTDDTSVRHMFEVMTREEIFVRGGNRMEVPKLIKLYDNTWRDENGNFVYVFNYGWSSYLLRVFKSYININEYNDLVHLITSDTYRTIPFPELRDYQNEDVLHMLKYNFGVCSCFTSYGSNKRLTALFKSSEKSGNIGEDCDVNTETTDGISQGSSAL